MFQLRIGISEKAPLSSGIAGMLLAQSLQSFLADPLEDPEVRQEVFRPLEWIWRGLGFTNEAAKHGKPTSG